MIFFAKSLTWRQGVRFITAIFVVVMMLFGCKIDPGDDFGYELNGDLTGTWEDKSWGGGTVYDFFTITATTLVYDNGFGGGYAGTIRFVTNFTENAGVIIIEYHEDRKPVYFDKDFNPTIPPKGNFAGIYYENLMPGVSVLLAKAIDLTDYTGAEKTTLDEAKVAFTSGRKLDYVEFMGTYLKKP